MKKAREGTLLDATLEQQRRMPSFGPDGPSVWDARSAWRRRNERGNGPNLDRELAVDETVRGGRAAAQRGEQLGQTLAAAAKEVNPKVGPLEMPPPEIDGAEYLELKDDGSGYVSKELQDRIREFDARRKKRKATSSRKRAAPSHLRVYNDFMRAHRRPGTKAEVMAWARRR